MNTTTTAIGTQLTTEEENVTVEPTELPNLSMSLIGVTTLSESSWDTYSTAYMRFYQSFYETNPPFNVTDLNTSIEFVSQDLIPRASQRVGERQM